MFICNNISIYLQYSKCGYMKMCKKTSRPTSLIDSHSKLLSLFNSQHHQFNKDSTHI